MDSREEKQGSSSLEFPFENEIIQIAQGLEGLKEQIEKYKGFFFCPYLADKTESEWDVSTSRRYMNQVLPNFLYIPVNIPEGDMKMLGECIRYASEKPEITAVNITKPHKSAPVLREVFFGNENDPRNVDTLIKSNLDNELHPFDLNAPAFVNWFEEEVEKFENKNIVIVGVGGVGEPVAKHIDKKRPASIHLVDVKNRSELKNSLDSETSFYHSLSDISPETSDLVVINASGKDGISDDTGLAQFLNAYPRGVFVDLRPQLQINIVEKAKTSGWDAYTGNGMNARNDYELLTGIMDYLNTPDSQRPSFQEFEQKVAAAS